MQSIGGFFDKFRNRAVTQINNLTIIAEVIKKVTGATIEMKDISFTTGTIKIKCPQIVKNEIFIKKEIILKELLKRMQSQKVSDIK